MTADKDIVIDKLEDETGESMKGLFELRVESGPHCILTSKSLHMTSCPVCVFHG